MTEFHFLRPYFLFGLIPLLIMILLFFRRSRSSDIWNKVCSKDLIPYIVVRKGNRNYFLPIILLASVSLLLIALAGPSWEMISQPLIKSQSGLVIALDLSPAMDAQDVKPSRLQRAIFKLSDFLKTRKDGQTALIVFSEEPFVVTPLTDDVATIKALLPALETNIMPIQGHQVNKAISKAAELLAQAGVSNGSILLITSELTSSDLDQSIAVASQSGTKISVLGIGKEEGTPIQKQVGGFVTDDKGALVITSLAKDNLIRLANATRGTYTTLTLDDADIKELANNSFDLTNSSEQSGLQHSKWHDQGYLFVLLALPFVSLLFRRGILIVLICLMPQMLPALSWNDFWKTPDQQGQELFHQENYQQAKEKFQNPDWQATSNYKLEDYKIAGDLFQKNQSPDGLYNYGTAKAKQGDFEEALAAYNKTLELQPDHEDAKYNKKLIEDFQKQQQQQQNQNDKNNENDDKKQNDSQDSNQDENQKSEEQQSKEQNESSDSNEEKTSELQDQYKDKVEKELEQKKSQELVEPEEESEQEDPQRQIDDKWLQKVKDDPGGLLRRKFLQQYQKRTREDLE